MKTPQKLKEVLEQFTPVYTIDGLTKQFEDIAQVVLMGILLSMVNMKFTR